MGIVSILSANSIMGIFVMGVSGYAYAKKKMEVDKVAMAKSASVTMVSCALFGVLGGPLLIKIVFVAVLTNLFRKKVLDNEKFHEFIKEQIKGLPREKIKEVFSGENVKEIFNKIEEKFSKAA